MGASVKSLINNGLLKNNYNLFLELVIAMCNNNIAVELLTPLQCYRLRKVQRIISTN